MTHYGIRNKNSKGWLRDQNGMLFATASLAVAEAQFAASGEPLGLSLPASEWEIAEFKLATRHPADHCQECGAGPFPIEGAEDCGVPRCPIDPVTGRPLARAEHPPALWRFAQHVAAISAGRLHGLASAICMGMSWKQAEEHLEKIGASKASVLLGDISIRARAMGRKPDLAQIVAESEYAHAVGRQPTMSSEGGLPVEDRWFDAIERAYRLGAENERAGLHKGDTDVVIASGPKE